MDPVTLTLIVGISTLLIERLFKWTMKIKSSSCCNHAINVEMKE
jgi:hypothetical protein